MARKKKLYLVLDTETATLPFADEIAGGDAEKKKRIAIAKPLIYDFAYCIVDRAGVIHDKKQFLIAETFAVPAIFNTAYYKEKRPIYLGMLERGETCIKTWDEVMQIFIKDMETVDAVGAFNSMFDYKKGISFTELYINKLYSCDYFQWEERQREKCKAIAEGTYKKQGNPDFKEDIFSFRGVDYPLFDLWGLAVTHLLNNATYKNKCLEHGLLTNSGTYFKSSAESTYKYLRDKYDFVEAHTALDDATIESYILRKVAQRHAITPGIKFFPFADLGFTYDYCKRRKRPKLSECEMVINAINAYLTEKEESGIENNYTRRLNKIVTSLCEYAGILTTP